MPNEYRRCCYNLLELMKAIIQYSRIKSKASRKRTFHIGKGSVSCNLCHCGRNVFHKETKQQPIRKAI